MTNIAFETPWALAGLLLMVLPMLKTGVAPTTYSWLEIVPNDPLSNLLSIGLRACGMAAVGALIFGLSGIYLKEQKIERIGRGAHIVLLLDRSRSMDDTFAGQSPDGEHASKAATAKRLLNDFVEQRRHDLIGVAAFSTSPLFVMPLTENKAAVKAAIAATDTPGLAYTNVSKGLMMATSFFEHQPLTGSRILLLISDGAAAIDPDSEQALRELIKRQQIRLYWVFLRTENSPGIFDKPKDARTDNADAMPERYLHLFFQSLNVPYQAYEAENPDAVQKAIADIDRLENRPLHYHERLPKHDLSQDCYRWAALFVLVLLGLKGCEVRR
ncbi:MAG: VWA domain-containing protein [Methylomicrobium sp.]